MNSTNNGNRRSRAEDADFEKRMWHYGSVSNNLDWLIKKRNQLGVCRNCGCEISKTRKVCDKCKGIYKRRASIKKFYSENKRKFD